MQGLSRCLAGNSPDGASLLDAHTSYPRSVNAIEEVYTSSTGQLKCPKTPGFVRKQLTNTLIGLGHGLDSRSVVQGTWCASLTLPSQSCALFSLLPFCFPARHNVKTFHCTQILCLNNIHVLLPKPPQEVSGKIKWPSISYLFAVLHL